MYLTWHQVWAAAGDPRAAEPLEKAYAIMQAQAAKIEDEAARQRFLENIPSHRQISTAYRQLHAEAAPSEAPAAPPPVAQPLT